MSDHESSPADPSKSLRSTAREAMHNLRRRAADERAARSAELLKQRASRADVIRQLGPRPIDTHALCNVISALRSLPVARGKRDDYRQQLQQANELLLAAMTAGAFCSTEYAGFRARLAASTDFESAAILLREKSGLAPLDHNGPEWWPSVIAFVVSEL